MAALQYEQPKATKRVTFHGSVVSDVLSFVSMNSELAKDIFYQPADISRFRREYRVHKQRVESEKINRMSQQARNELLMKQQRHQISSSMSILGTPPLRIPRSSMSHRGCALMA